MFSKSFEEMGIPPGYCCNTLLFSPAADALVVHAESIGNNWRPERLYFRHKEWEFYRPVGNPDELCSQDSPFVHSSKPLLAYNSIRHSFFIDPHGNKQHVGDWDSLRLFDLALGAELESVGPDSLRFPPEYVRGWIAELVAYGDSGLFVKAGLSSNTSTMDYFVAKLDLAQRILQPVLRLPAVFM
jgi:hypothetical protein